ncbi:MAG: universal stress protein [Gammaproteobacteria bacterium]|nr:universal stress protein [Gammaproteobacteria bacterium]
MIHKILVPIDGSEPSRKALLFACDLAAKYDASLDLLHVVQAPEGQHTMVLGAAAITVETSRDELEEAGRKAMQAATEIVDQLGCKLDKQQIEGGSPTKQILDHAGKNDIDLIIMGSRGLSDLGGILLGSVSHKVSHLAECSCVTMR